MAASDISLYNDIVNNRLILGLNNAGSFSLPSQFQGSKLSLRYYPVVPTYSATPPFFSQIDISSISPYLYIGPNAGTTALLASQETWTTVLTQAPFGYFAATLDLNTTQLNSALGSLASLDSLIEIHISEAGVRRVVYQGSVTVRATVYDIGGAVTLPSAAASYPTWIEALATFVKWNNNTANDAGKVITLISPSATKFRSIGVNDDGSALDDVA